MGRNNFHDSLLGMRSDAIIFITAMREKAVAFATASLFSKRKQLPNVTKAGFIRMKYYIIKPRKDKIDTKIIEGIKNIDRNAEITDVINIGGHNIRY